MNKDYQKPDFEYVSLIVEDQITADDDYVEGKPGLESSIFPL